MLPYPCIASDYLLVSLIFAPKNRKMTNRTFTMIKPDATLKGSTGGILDMINKAGFRIAAMKMVHLSAEKAGEFYACT